LDGLLDRALAVFGGNLGESPMSRHDHVPGCATPVGHADAQAHEYGQRSQSPELPVAQERCDDPPRDYPFENLSSPELPVARERCDLGRIGRMVSQHGNRFWTDHTEAEIALAVQS